MKVEIIQILRKIRPLLYPYLILLALSILLMLIYTKEDLYFAINRKHTVFADVFFTYITNIGDANGCFLIAILVTLFNYRKGFLLATSYIVTFIVSEIIKHLVQAPRPHLLYVKKLSGIYLVKGVQMLDVNSFPSGHSVSTFTAAVVLTYVARKKWYGFLMFTIGVSVAYSRMYLSEHFLQDVTAGSALGILVTTIWLSIIDHQPFLGTKGWNSGIFKINKNS